MKKRYKILICLIIIVGLPFILPEPRVIPVAGATSADWNSKTFWYEPWGSSGVHKGFDVFAKKGANVVASTHMVILYKGEIKKGGLVVLGLGPKWRLHYFAHLDKIDPQLGFFASANSSIGTVGDSGNAAGKQPHLHFSVLSLIPLPWRIDESTQGYKKAFYLNPIDYFSDS